MSKGIHSVFLVCLLIISMIPFASGNDYPTREEGPPAPQNVEAQPRDMAARITWEPPAGMTGNDIRGFKIGRGTTQENIDMMDPIANVGPFVNIYVNQGLTNGKTYYYSVAAINESGTGDPSPPISVVPRGPASPPTNLSSSYSSNVVMLSWEEPEDENGDPVTGYVVFKGTHEGNITQRNDVGMQFDFEDPGLINGMIYYYQVAAVNGAGDGEKTNIMSVTPVAPPTAPLNLSLKEGDGYVDIRWNDSESNGGAFIDSYSIYRGLSVEGMEKIGSATDDNNFRDEEVENGVTYYYSVAGHNIEGDGELASARAATPKGPPGEPLNLTLEPGDAKVTLSWKPPENNGGSEILGYRIYKNKLSEDMELDSDVGNVLEYTIEGLENKKIYYFQIRAYNNVGEGEGSETEMTRPEPLPKTPEDFRAIDLEEQVKLLWSKPSYTGEYPYQNILLYRGKEEGSLSLYKTLDPERTQFYDTDVEVGTVYLYELSIISQIGEGFRTPTVVGRPYDRPSVPLSFEAQAESNVVRLSWEQPEFNGGRVIESFNIFRGTDPDAITVMDTVEGEMTFYNDTKVTNGLTYFYRISAENKELEGNTTEMIEAIPRGAPEEPASGSGVPDIANETVKLTWSAPESNGGYEVTDYRIYRGLNRDNLTLIDEISADENYSDDDVEPGVGYYYSISAVNDGGEGPMSSVFYIEFPEEEKIDPSSDSGVLIWIIVIAIVVFLMIIIIIIALMSSKKKKESEEKEEVPELEESDAEREERLILERRKQMGDFTSISTSTEDAHSADVHGGSQISYEDLYGSPPHSEHQNVQQEVTGNNSDQQSQVQGSQNIPNQ